MEIIGDILLILAGIVGVLFTVGYFHSNCYNITSLIFKLKTKPAKKQHRYGFLICARNEEAVIADLIASIKAQNYPQELINIYVMADNCTDETAKCARLAGATKVYERFNTEKANKGFALTELCACILKDSEAMKCEGFFVFDADNLLDRDYTARMNDAFDNGARIATGYRCGTNFNDGAIAASGGFYFARDCFIMHKSRTLLKGSAMVTGTGWFFCRDILEKDNGWHWHLMAEDSEFSVVHVLQGEKVVYCDEAVFYDEQPATFSQSWKQRKRWLKGTAQVAAKYGKDLFLGIFKNKGNRFACYDLCVSLCSAVHLTAVAFAVGVLNCVYGMVTASGVLQALAVAAAYIFGLYTAFLIMALVPVVACSKRIPLSLPKKICYMLYFPIYMITYMPLALVVLLSKKVTWAPIEHGACEERKLYM